MYETPHMLSRQFLSDEKRVHTSQEIGRVRLYNVATCTGVKCFLYDLGRRFLTDEQYFGVGEILRSRRAASIDSDPIANIEINPSEGYVNTGIAKAVGVSKSGNPQVDRNAGSESELLRNLDYVKSD